MMTDEQRLTAFYEGARAFLDGAGHGASPYSWETGGAEWLAGWSAFGQHITDMRRAGNR